MLKKITICSICGSQSCDGKEWEIVPGDIGFNDYSALAGARDTFLLCSSMVSQGPKPVFTIIAGHGVSFDVCVREKKRVRNKK